MRVNRQGTMSDNRKIRVPSIEPTEPTPIEEVIELGELDHLSLAWVPTVPRYTVTYVNSQTADAIRSATVVSVTNRSDRVNHVVVSYLSGFTGSTSAVALSVFAIPPDFTVDFLSRSLPSELTGISAVCSPELLMDEGRAIVSSTLPEIAVSSHLYYTAGEQDAHLLGVADSDVIRCQRRGHEG